MSLMHRAPTLRPRWTVNQDDFGPYTVYALRAHDDLEPEAQEWLIQGLSRAMPTLKIREYFAIRRTALADSDHLIAAVDKETGELIGFLSSQWYVDGADPPFLHLSILLITHRYQRTQLIHHIWRLHLLEVLNGPHGFPWVVPLRTYNPVVYGAMRVFTRVDSTRLYPRIDGEPQDPDLVELATRIHTRIAPGLDFDPSTGVIRGAGVPRDFYPSLPECNKADVQKYFGDHLQPGDRLLCVLSFPRSRETQQRVLAVFGVAPDAHGAATPVS